MITYIHIYIYVYIYIIYNIYIYIYIIIYIYNINLIYFLQNSKFKIWPRGAAKFWILRRRVSIRRSVAVVASPSSPFFQNSKLKFGAGSDQNWILTFAASGLNQSVGRRRRISCKIQNSKFGRGERPNFEFWILRRRVSIIPSSRRVASC